jgi:histidinol-phosphate aminotransferase
MSATSPKPRPGILDIAPYVAGKSSARAGVRVVKLSANETPLGASPKAKTAFIEAAETLHRYPDGSAAPLRAAIGEAYNIPAEQIVCGAGSDELIGLLIHAYAGAGDEVLMSRHGFLMYKIYAQGFGVTTAFAPEKNLRCDVDALLASVTPRTKIVFIANPNNHTGSYVTKAELKRLHAGLRPDIVLAVDAAYSEYIDPKALPDYSDGSELVAGSGNVVVLHTFSKIYGLSALRLGFAYAPASICDMLGRIRGPFNVATPALMAGIAAVRDQSFIEQTRAFNTKWLAFMSKEIAALGLKVHPSIANFVLVEFPGGKHSAASANAYLAEQGLIVRDVVAYGLPDCLRITIGLEEDNKAVLQCLRAFLDS